MLPAIGWCRVREAVICLPGELSSHSVSWLYLSEKEDKIRELENMLDDQRIIIDNQNRRIEELELKREPVQNEYFNGDSIPDDIEESGDHSNGYHAGED